MMENTIRVTFAAFCCGPQKLRPKEKCPAIAENSLLNEAN